VEHARSATADDLADLVDLARHLRAELTPTRGGDLWAAHDVSGEPLEDVLIAAITSPDTLVVVGTIDAVPVGYGVVTVVDLRDGSRLGRVSELFVEPEARGVGVGEAIAGAVVEHCRGAGCRGVDVVALPGHRAAKNFFEEQGFTARAIVMHHTLTGEIVADQTDA
jgi:ribosomal protein S18 acetylase RimI-like enzyme